MRYWLSKNKDDGGICLWALNDAPAKKDGDFGSDTRSLRGLLACFSADWDDEIKMHNRLWAIIRPAGLSLRRGQCFEIENPELVLKDIGGKTK